MLELATEIPDPNVLLALEPEELAGKMLFLLRRREVSRFGMRDIRGQSLWETEPPGGGSYYPHERKDEIDSAIGEAIAWLVAQGLVIPAAGTPGHAGTLMLSRRASRFENSAEFADYRTARRLPKEVLHAALSGPVWMSFMRGEFDTAVFQALKAVEVAVRTAAGLSAQDIGTNLMRKAFEPENGPLTDRQDDKAEREARSALFAGAIGSYKNPQSHRDVNLDNPSEAIEIIMLANHLLRIVDARAAARGGS